MARNGEFPLNSVTYTKDDLAGLRSFSVRGIRACVLHKKRQTLPPWMDYETMGRRAKTHTKKSHPTYVAANAHAARDGFCPIVSDILQVIHNYWSITNQCYWWLKMALGPPPKRRLHSWPCSRQILHDQAEECVEHMKFKESDLWRNDQKVHSEAATFGL